MKIALLLIATGEKYHRFIKPLIESVRTHFLKQYNVDIILWTDSKEDYGVIKIEKEPEGVPFTTLMRYHTFLSEKDRLSQYDYLFYCDIDMLFVNDVTGIILDKGLVAVLHPGYASSESVHPLETNVMSTAFIDYTPFYFAGGFQGGKADKYIEAMESMKINIDLDLEDHFVAVWHDESHWNKYCAEHKPSVILPPSYCYPETNIEHYKKIWGRDYKPKLIALTK